MTRVLIVSNSFTPNNDALFRAIAARPTLELQVAYCAWREPHRLWSLPPDKGYDYTVMRGWSFGTSTHVNPAVWGLVRRYRPDVGVLTGSYTMPTFGIALLAFAGTGTPWVYWGEELQTDHATLMRRIGRAVLRRPLRAADGVLAIGRRAAESYARLGIPRERVANFHYYADCSNFRLEAGAREAVRTATRARLDIPLEDVVFLCCAQLIPRKGVDVALRALALLRERHRMGRMIVAGDGPDRDMLLDLTRRLGLETQVHFVGFAQPERLPEYFAASDALVLMSRQEGWGLVISEAMAAGLPVLASDRVNAAAELVEPGVSGMLVPSDDHRGLADAMDVLTTDRCAGRRMACAALRAAESETPERAAVRFEAIVHAVVQGAPLDVH